MLEEERERLAVLKKLMRRSLGEGSGQVASEAVQPEGGLERALLSQGERLHNLLVTDEVATDQTRRGVPSAARMALISGVAMIPVHDKRKLFVAGSSRPWGECVVC